MKPHPQAVNCGLRVTTTPIARVKYRPHGINRMMPPMELTDETLQQLADGSHELTFWREHGRVLAEADRVQQWSVGDWLLSGEQLTGRKLYPEAEAIFTGYRRQSLKQFARVARRYPACIRIHDLSWAHHQLVAGYSLPDRQEMLEQARKHGYSLSKFRAVVNRKFRKQPKPRTVCVHLSDDEYNWLHEWAIHFRTQDGEMMHRLFRDWLRLHAEGLVGDQHVTETSLKEEPTSYQYPTVEAAA